MTQPAPEQPMPTRSAPDPCGPDQPAPDQEPAPAPDLASFEQPWWWPTADGPEDDIDDDWDWDTELGRLDPWPDPGPQRLHDVPSRPAPQPLVRDLHVAVLDQEGVGEFVRSCRAAAGWSQRELAAAAGMPQSTVARVESGQSGSATRLATVVRLAEVCGVQLVGRRHVDAAPTLLRGDAAQRHRDHGDRMLPAHLVNQSVSAEFGGWWGDDRYTHGRGRPRRGYRHDRRYRELPDPPTAG